MHSKRRLVMLGYGKLSVTLAALAGFLLFYRRTTCPCRQSRNASTGQNGPIIRLHGSDRASRLGQQGQAEHPTATSRT